MSDRVESDRVSTPLEVARDIVPFFQPEGKCLDPCRGSGAFFDLLPPGSDWREIDKGRDFFDYTGHVDWIISNPPYSIWARWIRHSFTVADNIVYLIPLTRIVVSLKLLHDIFSWGGIPTIYVIGSGNQLDFPINFTIAAVHFKRAYTNPTDIVFSSSSFSPSHSPPWYASLPPLPTSTFAVSPLHPILTPISFPSSAARAAP